MININEHGWVNLKECFNEALHSIRIPDVQQEQLRSLFRRRFDLVKDFRRIKSRLKSFLLYNGIHVPEAFDNPNWQAILMVEQLVQTTQFQYLPLSSPPPTPSPWGRTRYRNSTQSAHSWQIIYQHFRPSLYSPKTTRRGYSKCRSMCRSRAYVPGGSLWGKGRS